MKRIKALALSVCLALCGCSGSAGDKAPVHEEAPAASDVYKPFDGDYSEDFEYVVNTATNVRMDVLSDGRLITMGPKINGGGTDFFEFALDGTSRKIASIDGYPDNMAYALGELLYVNVKWVGDNVSGGVMLFKVDTETGKTEKYAELNAPLTYCSGMSGNDSELYIFGDDPTREDIVNNVEWDGNIRNLPPSCPKSVYMYKNGETVRLPVDFPNSVCAAKNGGAIISAWDKDGYYIVRFKDGELTDKVYTQLNGVISGITDIDSTHVAFTMLTSSGRNMLCAADINKMYNAELIPDAHAYHDLRSAGGLCFYQDSSDKETKTVTIHRVQFSKYFRDTAPMKLITTELSYKTPFGCGYTISAERQKSSEAALKILSQDKDYDMCYISTGDDISYSIKSKGSFYPLNDVPGVREYLEKCFPSVKEAFTDENGDIWALPIWANTDFIFKNTGDVDYSKMKLPEFVEFIESLSDDDRQKVSFIPARYIIDVLTQYVMTHENFDTAEFREAAEKLKFAEGFYKITNAGSTGDQAEKEQLLTITDPYVDIYNKIISSEYTVSGMPGISEPNIIVPDVMFLCVNPSSEHLRDALSYIERVAEYQLTAPDQYLLTYENGAYSGSGTVKQMTGLLENAGVYFKYPSELYWDDFDKYLSGEITLGDFIKEADRKLKTYLNE